MRIGVSQGYFAFLDKWASAASEPPHVFKADLDAMFETEVVEMLQPFVEEITARLTEMAEKRDPVTRALDRLFNDLLAHLERHDCEQCEAGLECAERLGLAGRIRTAQQILTQPPVPAGT